jgi:hypothetical protein
MSENERKSERMAQVADTPGGAGKRNLKPFVDSDCLLI